MDEDTFGFFEGIVRTHLPDYDHYAFTEASVSLWKPVIERFKGFATELRAARSPAELPSDIHFFMNDTEHRFTEDFSSNVQLLQEVASDLIGWLEAQSKQHETITILGL
ncbi:MAG: hypothetical protein RLZZ341_1266 [Pseudomonadota bacterium]